VRTLAVIQRDERIEDHSQRGVDNPLNAERVPAGLARWWLVAAYDAPPALTTQ